MSRNDRNNWQVFIAVTVLVAAISAGWLATAGLTDDNVRLALRESAYLAFVLYVVVLVARPLQQLLRKNWTAALLRNRRLVGVAFAAAMTAHFGLIVFRFNWNPDLDFSFVGSLAGIAAYSVFYAMLITSFDTPKKALGPGKWKFLHRFGLLFAAVIFATPRPLEAITEPDYLVFGIPFAIAVLIRLTAWLRSRRRGS